MSQNGEDMLDPDGASVGENPASPGWMGAGYLLGLLSMSAAPSLFFWFSSTVSWFFAPLVPLLVALACALIGTTDRRVSAAAAKATIGAAMAAAFGAVAVTALLLGLAIDS